MKPELFDGIELLANFAEVNLKAGDLGSIVEKYDNGDYEVEFENQQGETIALVTLKPEQFIVVWQYTNHAWVPLADRIHAMLEILPEDQQKQVLDFTRSQVLDCTRSLHRVPA